MLQFCSGLLSKLKSVDQNITVYQIFAIATVVMVYGHFASLFLPDVTWMKVLGRIFYPVFGIAIGYNIGQKIDPRLVFFAVVLILVDLILACFDTSGLIHIFPMSILVTIIVARLTIGLVMRLATNSSLQFWAVFFALVILIIPTAILFRYGTLGLILAMAGWILRSQGELQRGRINVKFFLLIVYLEYMTFMQAFYGYSLAQFTVTAIGCAYVFYLMYNLKSHLLQSLRHKPRDTLSRTCYAIGQNSLEIYFSHAIVLSGIYFYAINVYGP